MRIYLTDVKYHRDIGTIEVNDYRRNSDNKFSEIYPKQSISLHYRKERMSGLSSEDILITL